MSAPDSTVTTLAEVTAERVAWLWLNRLPRGKVVVFDGDPATGKSTLTLDLGARVSAGKDWPDGAPGGDPAGVLLLSAEDGLADTIVPRLTAAGADLARVHALTEVVVFDEDGAPRQVPPSLPRDLAVIERVVTEKNIKLVVVDVLMAYLSGKVDSHRDQDVRGVLHQLAAMAERTGATVVLVRHLNKASGSNALYRGGGSIGIVGAARAAYLVARDPEDADRRIFAVTKSNLTAEPPSLAYRLVDDPTNGCARVQWEDGPVDHTAATLLRDAADDETRTERDEAVDWLTGYLKANGGQAPRKDVMKAAAAERFSERTLKRAAARAGVVSERYGYPAVATWSLPVGPPSTQYVQGGPTGGRGPTGVDPGIYPDPPAQSAQLGQPSGSGPTEPTADQDGHARGQLRLVEDTSPDCGHPASVMTTTGKCALCIAAKHAAPARL
ncbi:AAA domain-containing protein [Geodermatophilus amargosae]|uniref:AAA domain-containing protein n=1 Tax=Geodermatophilus amargosae TaxID=1296565 RepID=A0A1I7CC38_9ACTN|nr:AAA family ATPase [Geodermatophilus amargosae]SFT96962.1 AAA domain-containing protein [Geodermatophilus amargosae]